MTRTLAHRASTHHKMSVDVPNELFTALAEISDARKIGIGPLLCDLAKAELDRIAGIEAMEDEWRSVTQKPRNEER